MKQATDLQLEHVSCYYGHLWCLILLFLLPVLSVVVTSFFASTQWDSPWYGMLLLLCFRTGASLQEKASLFTRQRRRPCKWQHHLEAKKFEIRKRFCKSEVQNQLWWASLQSGSDPQWTLCGKIPALKLYDSETGQKWCHEGLLKVLLPWDHGLKVCMQGEEICLVDMWMHPQWCLQWDPRSGCCSLPV